MPTASVRVDLAGEDIVALCDTGSGGMGVGLSLINEDVCSRWRRKIREKDYSKHSYTHNCGWTNIKYYGRNCSGFCPERGINTAGNACSTWDDSAMIFGWDFCLTHRACVDASAEVSRFYDTSVPLLSREELVPEPSMVRVCQRTQIPARSEKLVVGQMDCTAGWRYSVLVDPQNVFVNDDGLAVARTVSTVKEGCCAVQVVNVTDVELTIEARVPLGIGYPVKSDSQTECAAIFMYELQDLTMPEVVADISVSPCAVVKIMVNIGAGGRCAWPAIRVERRIQQNPSRLWQNQSAGPLNKH